MKKFVMMREYLTNNSPLGYIGGERRPVAVANDLNTLMGKVVDCASSILQVRNPNCLKIGKWDVRTDGKYAEIVITETIDDNDAVRFIIQETEFIC